MCVRSQKAFVWFLVCKVAGQEHIRNYKNRNYNNSHQFELKAKSKAFSEKTFFREINLIGIRDHNGHIEPNRVDLRVNNAHCQD